MEMYGLTSMLAFAMGVAVLEFFDISLPRGDSLGVSGALISAGIVVLGPLEAFASALLGMAAAFVVRRHRERTSAPKVEFPALVGGFAAASIVWLGISRALGGASYALPIQAVAVSLAYLAAELVMVQLLVAYDSSRSALRLIRGNVSRQAALMAAELSACLLVILIYDSTREWSLVLVVFLLLLIRQSYALLLDVRETYRRTVEVLVEVAEGAEGEEGRRGHAERTAAIAREIASACGIRPAEVERISYTALLHDLAALRPNEDPVFEPVGGSAAVLEGVSEFDDVCRLLRLLEAPSEAINPPDADIMSAYVVALANDIDEAKHPAVHGMRLSPSVERLSARVPAHVKAKAVAAAVRLGYGIPAVS